MKYLYACLIVTLLSVQTPLFAECQDTANDYAEDYEEDAIDFKNDFLDEVDDLRQAYARGDAYLIEQFDKFYQRILEVHDYDGLIEHHTVTYPNNIRDVPNNTADDYLCENTRKLMYITEHQLSLLEPKLELIITDIEERVELEQLDNDEGLVLIAADINGYADTVYIKSEGAFGDSYEFGPVKPSRYFKIIKLSEGRYYWDRFEWAYQYGKRYYDFSKLDLSFEVKAGKLNLVGDMIHRERGYSFNAYITDRTALLLKELKETYPGFLEQYEIHNGIAGFDIFSDFYQKQQKLVTGNPSLNDSQTDVSSTEDKQ